MEFTVFMISTGAGENDPEYGGPADELRPKRHDSNVLPHSPEAEVLRYIMDSSESTRYSLDLHTNPDKHKHGTQQI